MIDQQKAPDAANVSGLGKAKHSNSSAAQRQRLLAALETRNVSTIDARGPLDILSPAARIMELRKRGHRIDTARIVQQTECGKRHNVALYVLQPAACVPAVLPESLHRAGGAAQAQGAFYGET